MESTWYKGFRHRQRDQRKKGLSHSASAPLLASPVQPVKPDLSSTAQSFLARQRKHGAFDKRLGLAKAQIEVTKAFRSMDDVEFWGAQGIPGFLTYLTKKFGSILTGWRALDKDRNGRITFYEFCNACRQMGYHGNLKQLWNDLDKNLNGSISLMELDPDAGKVIGEFKLALMNEYGDMATAWEKGIDINKTGRIEEEEIVAAVKRLGLKMNPHKLYCMLRCAPGKHSKGVTLKDFDADAHQRLQTGDRDGLVSRPNTEFLEDLPGMGEEVAWPEDVQKVKKNRTGGAMAWKHKLKAEDFAILKKALGDIAQFDLGLHNPEKLKHALIGRCGSLLSAWRNALDLDGNGRLSPGEFSVALHRLAFHGDIKGVFNKLDADGKGYLLFADLDPETDKDLSELRAKLEERFGNMLLAWIKGLDKKGTGFVTKADFVKTCSEVGFGGNPAKLFRKLKPEVGRQFLCLRDFDTKAHLALSRGDYRMLTEGQGVQIPEEGMLYMSFEERQNCGFFHQIRQAWDASRRDEFAKACMLANVAEHRIDTPEELEHLCIRRYGSIIQAWHQCLDLDHNGRLTFNEFCDACRRLGYAGDLKALFHEYGGKEKGHITLKDLDPHGEELVRSFLELLKERYGHVDIAWRKGFGKDPHDSIDEGELKKACQVLGYPHSIKKLFKYLVPMKGQLSLTIWDIDPTCERERARGGGATAGAVAGAPKSPTHFAGRTGHAFGANDTINIDAETPKAGSGAKAATKIGSGTEAARVAMRSKHGSTAAAWRAVIGAQAERTDYPGLCRLMRDCEFQGSLSELWREVSFQDADATHKPATSSTSKPAPAWEESSSKEPKYYTSFKRIDPQAQALLHSVRAKLLSSCGSLRKTWRQLLEAAAEKKTSDRASTAGASNDDSGPRAVTRVDLKCFVAFCEQNTLQVKAPERAFKCLLSHPGQRSLCRRDLETLLMGVPAEQHPEIWGEAGEKATEKTAKEHVELQRAEVQKTDLIVRSLDDFKKMLCHHHGSLFSAWRQHFDLDDNLVVTRAEFAKGCQKLGIRAVKELWAQLDQAGREQIGLADLDPEVAELYAELTNLLVAQFGTAELGWRKHFEKPHPRSKQIDKTKFARQCEALGVARGERLFRLVRPDNGRKGHLVFEDLWRSLNRNGTIAESRQTKHQRNAFIPSEAAPKKIVTQKDASPPPDQSKPEDECFVLVEDVADEANSEPVKQGAQYSTAATARDEVQKTVSPKSQPASARKAEESAEMGGPAKVDSHDDYGDDFDEEDQTETKHEASKVSEDKADVPAATSGREAPLKEAAKADSTDDYGDDFEDVDNVEAKAATAPASDRPAVDDEGEATRQADTKDDYGDDFDDFEDMDEAEEEPKAGNEPKVQSQTNGPKENPPVKKESIDEYGDEFEDTFDAETEHAAGKKLTNEPEKTEATEEYGDEFEDMDEAEADDEPGVRSKEKGSEEKVFEPAETSSPATREEGTAKEGPWDDYGDDFEDLEENKAAAEDEPGKDSEEANAPAETEEEPSKGDTEQAEGSRSFEEPSKTDTKQDDDDDYDGDFEDFQEPSKEDSVAKQKGSAEDYGDDSFQELSREQASKKESNDEDEDYDDYDDEFQDAEQDQSHIASVSYAPPSPGSMAGGQSLMERQATKSEGDFEEDFESEDEGDDDR
eukprot:TRINITY_DN12838_c0_g1_i2.p1 TRINITY_DN12838_c0_g1~~TRINITY_DN12838_c0_g1_i2.p1  ORF type:complete len:1659 (-),score=424.51 TRINITY_DN12838_c0_g1_i2:53-5029(-)